MSAGQADIAAATEWFFEPYRQPILITAGDQGRARRGAYCGISVRLGELHALGGNAVYVGRLIIPSPIAGDVRIPEIVRHDEYKVGRRIGGMHSFGGKRDSGRNDRLSARQ